MYQKFFVSSRLNERQKSLLDVIRGSAAQIVVLRHGMDMFVPGSVLGRVDIGELGVAVFFLLSGFLITGLLVDALLTDSYSPMEFFVARFVRIYIPYVPAIALIAVLDSFSRHSNAYLFGNEYSIYSAITNLFMLQSFVPVVLSQKLLPQTGIFIHGPFGSGSPFWTICIEWWIYVTVGLLAMLLVRRGSIWVYAALLFASVTPLYFLIGGFGDSLTFTWVMGGVVAIISKTTWAADILAKSMRWNMRRLRIISAVSGVLFILRVLALHGRIYDPLATIYLASMLFAFVFAHADPHQPKLRLGMIAGHSYSLYLIHNSILVFILCLVPSIQGWTAIGVGLAIANLMAYPFSLVFEKPHRRLRDRLIALTRRKDLTSRI